jgi:hypothetical protein
MKKVFFFSILLIVTLVLGCTSQIAVKQAVSEPNPVTAGEDAKFSVLMKGSKDKVTSVIIIVREYPEFTFSLYDNGENGDEMAGDNIWSFKYTIPNDAPPDLYHLDICVKDKNGNEIITKGFENQSFGRSGTIELTVK